MISATTQHTPPNIGPGPRDLAHLNLEDDASGKHQYYWLVMSA